MSSWVRRSIAFLAVLVIAAGGYWLATHKQDVLDWWQLQNYKPSADISALADSAGMQGRGRDLFYVSDPKVNERDQFNQNCTDNGKESLVLGCYKAQSIYIYNVTEPKLKGVKEVTAAHEMLHAAYERLEPGEKDRINNLLQAEITKISDPRLSDLIKLYNKDEPGEMFNEMHSILGTEFSSLSPELEVYYKQYFSDRARVVTLANNYATIFTESQKRIDSYDKQLASLKQQIDTNSTDLDNRRSQLSAQGAQLDALRNSDPIAYNSAVPTYNANVRAYNNLASKTRDLVNQYNSIVQSRNGEVAAQSLLYHSLDSNYQPVGTN